jgi:hypothetical protein
MVVRAAALVVLAALQRQREMGTLRLYRQAKAITVVIMAETSRRLILLAAVAVLAPLVAAELPLLLEVEETVLRQRFLAAP